MMFPMISTLEEFRAAKKILEECRQELRKKGTAFDEKMEVGIMVEVPAAALAADSLAKEADFFSLGTNDLIQYTLAVDRVNDEVAELYDPLNPAILRLIDRTVQAARAAGRWVGICGEMAGDPDYAPILVGMELDELSVSPALVPRVKKTIRDLSFADCRAAVKEILAEATSENIRKILRQMKKQ
jgi:phosphotransferase system enzyme I (PtsI)